MSGSLARRGERPWPTGRPSTPQPQQQQQQTQSPTKRALATSPETSPQPNTGEVNGHGTAHAVIDSPRVSRAKVEAGEVAIRATSTQREATHAQEEQLRGTLSSTPPAEDGLFSPAMVGLGVGLEAESERLSARESAERQTRRLGEVDPVLGARLSSMCSQFHLSDYNNSKRFIAQGITPPGAGANFTSLPPPPPPQRAHSSPPMPPSAPSPALISAPIASVKPNDVELEGSAAPTPVRIAQPALLAPVPTRPAFARAATGWSNILRTATAALGSASTSQAQTPAEDLSREGTPAQFVRMTPPRGKVEDPTERTTLTPALSSLAFGRAQDVQSATGQRKLDGSEIALKAPRDEQEEEPAGLSVNVQPPLSALPPMPPFEMVGGVHLLPGMKMMNGVAVRTSASHPMNISPIVPPEMIATLSSAILGSSRPDSPHPQRTPLAPSSAHNSPAIGAPRQHKKRAPFLLAPNPSGDLHSLVFSGPHPALSSPMDGPQKKIGNFFLSSCPGKKVRLDGSAPRGGRSAICRDVKMDLARAKGEGVRVVICCLEDSELAFLGAPWEEYSAAAGSLGLAVVRIPMVEGFAPSSPAELDGLMDGVIAKHTLKGESVLAHCRGGIGRAGLVACAWMLKMGFVWAGQGQVVRGREGVEDWGEEWSIVERTIDLIRRRRSAKAIETAQQVHFLLQYVGWLKDNAAVASASDLVG